MTATAPTYLAVGHVCVDELVGGERLGGTVFFSSGQAAAMGCRVSIVTACTAPTLARARATVGPDIVVHAADAATDTRFAFGPDAETGPERLVSRAPVIDALPETAGSALDIVHLAPVFDELSPSLLARARHAARFVGATPQGLLRGTDAAGRLTFEADHWPADPSFADAIVLNDDEYAHLAAVGLLDRFDGWVLRTLGPDGAALLRGGAEVARFRPSPTDREVVPQRTIGAGDVFAAAAFVALASDASPSDALCAAVESATAYVRRDTDEPRFTDAR